MCNVLYKREGKKRTGERWNERLRVRAKEKKEERMKFYLSEVVAVFLGSFSSHRDTFGNSLVRHSLICSVSFVMCCDDSDDDFTAREIYSSGITYHLIAYCWFLTAFFVWLYLSHGARSDSE